MSLLMDALRKAEEAKKKAAQDAESKQASATPEAEEPQESVAAENIPEGSSSPPVELSMADMEEVPARSAVPNLETPIEFDDEEDSVLPTSPDAPEVEQELGAADDDTDVADSIEVEFQAEEEIPKSTADPEIETEPEPDFELDMGLESESDSEAVPEPDPDPDPHLDQWLESELEAEIESDAVADVEAEIDTKPKNLAEISARIAAEEEAEAKQRELDAAATEEGPDEAAAPTAGTIDFDDLEDDEVEPPEEIAEAERSTAKAEEQVEADVFATEPIQIERTDRGGRKSEESGQRSARNVFAAKKSSVPAKRKIQIAVGSGLFLLLFAIGTYFYIALNQESAFNIPAGSYVASEYVDTGVDLQTNTVAPDSDTGEPIDSATVGAELEELIDRGAAGDVAQVTSTLEELLSEAEFPDVPVVSEPNPGSTEVPPETELEETPDLTTVATTIGGATTTNPEPAESVAAIEPVSEEPEQAIIAAPPQNLISFQRQENVVAVDPNLASAYVAYQQGSLIEAENFYRAALAVDPMQRDALLGLATIAAQNGDSAQALDLYSRMLARNPRDPIARAGLMEILPAGSSADQEADLKRLLNEYPNVAALSYAQGNFLASNQRWSEAQQAYFRALQLAKADAAIGGRVNPDYAFNLAVSLEHLNQGEPAQNYYREALDFAANHPAGFDLAAVRSRLASMGRSSSDE